jgi:uncharacterized delta-60 repeat protein
MIGTGHGKNKRTGALLLLLLFILGLTCLALPEAAESGVATAWVRRYDPGVGHHRMGSYPGTANAMVLDGQGNIYVAGSSYKGSHSFATIKYSPDGQRLWVRSHFKRNGEPHAIALDGLGNVLVTGGIGFWWGEGPNHSDYATVKYNPGGLRLWARTYDGKEAPPYIADWDEATAMAVDTQGNVYVTGTGTGTGTSLDIYYQNDCVTIKYGPDGRRLWLRRYNTGGYGDGAAAIAVDRQGNIYITGLSYRGYYTSGFLTIKYSSDGHLLWVSRYNGPGSGTGTGKAIAIDSQGNVLVTGYSWGAETGYDYTTIKYSPDGEEIWVARYDGPGHGDDQPSAIAVDSRDNIYVTGKSKNSADTSWNSDDYATIKYSPEGEELWVRRYDGPGHGYDCATAMALDTQGNVYVTGTSEGVEDVWSGWCSFDYATVKYSPAGETLWIMRYDGPGNTSDSASAIAVDGQGNVYVTGTSVSYNSGGYISDSSYVTIKYIQTPRDGR